MWGWTVNQTPIPTQEAPSSAMMRPAMASRQSGTRTNVKRLTEGATWPSERLLSQSLQPMKAANNPKPTA